MEKINPFAFFYYHLYLLQLEEYNPIRFLNIIRYTRGIPPRHLRKKLMWTGKMVLIAILSFALIVWAAYAFSLVFLITFYISFIPIGIIVIVLTPLDTFLKNMKIKKAKVHLDKYPHIKIIGIAGSYGKTTMKEAVSTILAQKFVVVKTPENINTPLGIAETILKEVGEKTEVLVVEMGEYKQGDIRDICSLVKPQIGIITGINEAHLERMGSLENSVSTIFELAQCMEEKGLLIVNNDDMRVASNYKKFISHQHVIAFSSKNSLHLKSGLLGRYASGVLMAADAVAKELGLDGEQIKQGASLIKPLPHRLEPIVGARGVLIIDDSYNGNPEGVGEAIHLLSTYRGRRKVYITPGLVETGGQTVAIHKKIGKELAPVADLVVLIKNSVTPFIAEGLIENGFKKENIRWYKTSASSHADIGSIVEPNDVVLFQNDWPDNYV